MPERWVLPDKASALSWCEQRNEQGIRCILDILGRYYREEAMARTMFYDYLALIRDISDRRLTASISVKPSTLGGTANRELALNLARELCAESARLGVPFELDMEGRRMVDLTLAMAEDCARSGLPVTVALQAYLRRTGQDIDTMLDASVTIRLVKGAYAGDLTDFDTIAEVFKDLAEMIIDWDVPFSVATHDPDILRWVERRISDYDILELAFLKGLSDETKETLASSGRRVAEYVPFGKNKEGYDARRRTYLARLNELGRSPAP